jgi:long-chain acyl-CoA synthetase
MGMRTSLASLVEDFRTHVSEIAVVEHRGVRSYAATYGDLAEIAGRFAAELERRQIVAGERVVLWGANSAAWIGVFFGCLLRGVIVVPLDAAGTSDFAARVVEDTKARLVVGDRELLAGLGGDVARMVLASLVEELPLMPLFAVSEAVKAETPFQIVFTSGTTSEPKGIVHTHRNVLASLQPIEEEMAKYRRYERWVHPLRFLHTLPLSHVFGQFMGLWIPAVLAAEVHFADAMEPARMTELLRRERISVLVAVPRVLQLMQSYLVGRFAGLAEELRAAQGVPAWKRWWRFRRVHRALGWKFWAVISGGATLPAEVEAFWNGLGLALVQGYGMTETAALVTLNHPFHVGRGTIGKALPGREVKLSEEGEILVRGDMLSGATWQGGAMRAREGEWLATGDLAAREDSGELRFLGRKDDVIVTAAGMNVHPADLGAAMLAQAGVRGCVVVGCGTEAVAGVLFAGSDAEMQAAMARANEGLAEFQRMRRVLRWPELQFPHTSTGKLLRRQIAAWACAAIVGRQVVGAVGGDELLAMVAEVTGEAAGRSDDAARLSEDLRLDSLGRVQLQTMIEQRLGVEVGDDAMAAVATLGELRGLVSGNEVVGPRDFVEARVRESGPGAPGRGVSGDFTAEQVREEMVYPRWSWWAAVRAVRVMFVEVAMRPVVWLLAALRVVLPQTALPRGPVLVIANHVSAYDGALVLYALPQWLRRRMAAAMAGEMLMDLRRGRNQGSAVLNVLAPLGYWLVTALFNVFPLPRMRGFRRSFAHAGEAMDRGYSVMIFPEGTRSADGKLAHFRAGIGLLAKEAAVPVIPVALVGLGEMRARGASWLRSGKLEVRVGDAVCVRDDEDAAELTARLEESVRQLLQ